MKLVFSKDVSIIVEDILGIESTGKYGPFNTDRFMDKLEEIFVRDAYHLGMMAKGKILTKYHHVLLRGKSMGPLHSPPSDSKILKLSERC